MSGREDNRARSGGNDPLSRVPGDSLGPTQRQERAGGGRASVADGDGPPHWYGRRDSVDYRIGGQDGELAMEEIRRRTEQGGEHVDRRDSQTERVDKGLGRGRSIVPEAIRWTLLGAMTVIAFVLIAFMIGGK